MSIAKNVVVAIIGVVITLSLAVGVMTGSIASALMFSERVSPFSFEETVARIQDNIIRLEHKGWKLSGRRNPAAAIAGAGGRTLPVETIEACSTRYSEPILDDDRSRFLSILMPCKIAVYMKDDGKVYIANMNAGLVGPLFGTLVGGVMGEVAKDQESFLVMDPTVPAPRMLSKEEENGSVPVVGAGALSLPKGAVPNPYQEFFKKSKKASPC